MPLDPLQDRIARTVGTLPEAHTVALAGGGAMIAHGFVTRETKDVDLFTEIDDGEPVRVATGLRQALERQGLRTRNSERPPFDHQFFVVDPTSGAECTVEVLAGGGRLRPRVLLDIGPVLHPDDLAADKVLALWGRARPRDFFDVAALLDRFGPAAGIGPGQGYRLHRRDIPGRASRHRRLTPADWAEDGVSQKDAQRLRGVFDNWRVRLESSD